jgi:hypothetical protein
MGDDVKHARIAGTACDCGRMANHGHCGAAGADIRRQDISANMF